MAMEQAGILTDQRALERMQVDFGQKICELENKLREDENKISVEIDEVNAQLSMCETYEQKETILKRYNVINENGRINA